MGKGIRIFLFSAVIGLLSLQLVGCKNENTQEPPAKTKLAAVTNVKAYSFNETSVGLSWSHSSDQPRADLVGYLITVKNPDGTTRGTPSSITKDTTKTVVSGLQPGIYTFQIASVASGSSANYANSDSATIRWSPAARFNTEQTFDIRVYETTSSTSFASALIFALAPDTLSPKTVSVANPGSYYAAKIDMYLASSGANNVEIRSAHIGYPTRRTTLFSTTEYDVASLDDPQSTPPDVNSYTRTNILLDSLSVPLTAKVLYFRTDLQNYGRLLLKRSSQGKLIWGSSPEQYINVTISYQTQSGNPFAKPWKFPSKENKGVN
jgi:hypothetical protein